MNDHPIVLFDGECNFCNGVVNFLLKQDKKKVLRFAAMQSAAGEKLLQQYGFPKHYLKSFVLIDNGKAYKKSTAGLRLYGKLPWYWGWTQIFWVVPKPIRDIVYEAISDNRYNLFGKRNACIIPTPEMRSRFL
ncbi:MAG TPA: thiol-disulfide oxidoreductase DCC family protein [Flavisolibacter sp.]|jgi:predicted DCC family thiol-disulfide oxidoreductase YuxK|nr:thiol-disulfide oxidoreductase DCC family protein [Flavisolibacter sp.]